MDYQFLTDIYETERLKVLSVWSMFHDEDMERRPHPSDKRGRSVREQMIHQCMSEDAWFRNMFGCDLGSGPVPGEETKTAFLEKYAADSLRRLEFLRRQSAQWWRAETAFFNVPRSRAWIIVRRIAHTAHHRGQQTTMLRMLARGVYSTYGPTADTGGLPKNGASTIYAYADEASLLSHAAPQALPASVAQPVTERPD